MSSHLKTLATIVAAFAIAGLVISGSYTLVFGYDEAAIPLHTLLLALYSLCAASLCLLLARIVNPRKLRVLLVFSIWFVFLLLLSAIYISSVLSSYFWSEPMYDKLLFNSFSLLVEYYRAYLDNILAVFPILFSHTDVPGNIGLMIRSLTIGLLCFPFLLALMAWLAVRLTRAIVAPTETTAAPALLAVIFLSCIATTVWLQSVCIDVYAEHQWRGEVLTDTFFSGSSLPYSEPYRQRLAEQDRSRFDQMPVTRGTGT